MKVTVKAFMKFTALKGINMKDMSALLKSVVGKTADIEIDAGAAAKDLVDAARIALSLTDDSFSEVYLEIISEKKIDPGAKLSDIGLKEGSCVNIVFFKKVN